MLKEDVIMLSDLTPAELIEYKFAGGDWMTSWCVVVRCVCVICDNLYVCLCERGSFSIGVDSLENYRCNKANSYIWIHVGI